jgi:glycerophosphoryl diester phosphodiesterase
VLIVSAHQGYPRLLNSGADFLEIDIRRNKDGVTVISHDEPRPGRKHVTLDEVLDAAAGRVGLQLDLKEPGYEVELIRSALDRLPPDKLVVTTEVEDSIRLIKDQFPEIRAGLTTRRVEPNHADFIALDQRYASDGALALAERYGIKVWVWTVDDRRLMERFVSDRRVEGLITNRPEEALKLRSARS